MPTTHRKAIAKLLTILGSLMLSIFAGNLRYSLSSVNTFQLLCLIVLGFLGLILVFVSLLLEY